MAGWEMPVGIVLTIVGGFALALQAGVNATLGSHITKPVSSIISFGMGLAACCIYLLVDATAVSKQLPSVADFRGAPWWSWVGGPLGAYYVVVNVIFALKLGAGTAVSVFVCSQLAMSIVLDLTGLVGFQKRAFSWPRITGVALMIMGVILVTQFPGAPILPPKPPQQDPEAQQQGQEQPQQHAKQLKQSSWPELAPQGATESSLVPAARLAGSSTSGSSSRLGGSSGSTGSLELSAQQLAPISSSDGGSRGLRFSSMMQRAQNGVPVRRFDHHQHTDVQVKVVDQQR